MGAVVGNGTWKGLVCSSQVSTERSGVLPHATASMIIIYFQGALSALIITYCSGLWKNNFIVNCFFFPDLCQCSWKEKGDLTQNVAILWTIVGYVYNMDCIWLHMKCLTISFPGFVFFKDIEIIFCRSKSNIGVVCPKRWRSIEECADQSGEHIQSL